MPRSDKYCYVSVRLPKGEALERLQEEAAYYGKSERELIADVALAWTKMLKGEWNFHWPLALPMPPLPPMLAGQATSGTPPVAETTPAAQREAEARAAREEAERKQRERREARLAAARAELLD